MDEFGIGQPVRREEDTRLLTGRGTFQDRCPPRAADAPASDLCFDVVPCLDNDFGVNGAGEGGACGAPLTVVSPVFDAPGVPHIDTPPTPARVRRAVSARAAA